MPKVTQAGDAPVRPDSATHPSPIFAELAKQGDYAYDVSAIDDGEVLRDGERVATLGPGDFFDEIGATLEERRHALAEI